MPSARRGLVAPQNTFLENIMRRSSVQQSPIEKYGPCISCIRLLHTLLDDIANATSALDGSREKPAYLFTLNCLDSNFLLANAQVVEYPVVYSNDGFCKMTGYNRAEVMQRSAKCSFMYGDLTDKETIQKVEEAFEKQEPEQVELLIYKKNRTPMWTLLQVAPIKNEKDHVVLFLCTFKDITALKQPIEDENAKGLGKFARLARTVTRSRSVLVQVAQHININKSEQNKQTQISQMAHMMSLDAEVLPQYKREAPKTPPHIILHYCTFKAIWDWVILALTFYTAVAVPFNVAFDNQSSKEYVMMVIDGIVDIVFFIDVILNFHTTFVGPGGEVVSDPKVIRMNYLKTWFVIDLLSCLPYDVINAFQQENHQLSSIFSALKVVRLLRLGRVVRKLDHYIEYGIAFLILLMLTFLLFAHWFACLWYTIGNEELKDVDQRNGWLWKLGNDTNKPYYMNKTTNQTDGGPDTGMKYVSALYFTMSSLTSVGFGNISSVTAAEKIFTICMMVVGSLLYASIFGNVTTIFQEFTSNTARYHEVLNSVREFMKLHQVDKQLAERVVDYVISSWAVTKGIDKDRVLSHCPKDMKADVCVHLNRRVFNEHPAFRLASEGCLRALAIQFNMSHSAPGDLLIHSGESVDQLCFVVSGSLEIIQDDEVVAILGKGDVFGDVFWKEPTLGQSAANVKALTYCDLHTIKRDDLLEVLDFYSSFSHSFARNMVLTYNLRHRLVFRKVADVKREREEAEKRKNDPPIPADHPVRKMFNKFRKLSDVPEKKPPASPLASLGLAAKLKMSANNNNPDVEKGEATGNGPVRDGIVSRGPTLSRVPENSPDTVRTIRVRMPDVKGQAKVPKGNGTLKALRTPDAAPKEPPASKWGMFKKSNLKKAESTDSGILRSEQKLDEVGRTDSKEGSSSNASSTDQQLLASLMEIKVELKEEIEALSVKMSRLDDQIADIIKFFSPDSSPYSSNVPSSNSSRVGSCNEVPIGSPQKSTSATTAPVGSPKKTAIVLHVREQGDSSDSHDSTHSVGSGERRSSSVTSHGSNGSRHSSGRRSPIVVSNHTGPTPVESPSMLNLPTMEPEPHHQETIVFTEIESPPSPENSNVSHF